MVIHGTMLYGFSGACPDSQLGMENLGWWWITRRRHLHFGQLQCLCKFSFYFYFLSQVAFMVEFSSVTILDTSKEITDSSLPSFSLCLCPLCVLRPVLCYIACEVLTRWDLLLTIKTLWHLFVTHLMFLLLFVKRLWMLFKSHIVCQWWAWLNYRSPLL